MTFVVVLVRLTILPILDTDLESILVHIGADNIDQYPSRCARPGSYNWVTHSCCKDVFGGFYNKMRLHNNVDIIRGKGNFAASPKARTRIVD
ncbi:hypothetical protein TSUD_262890 [Trifolium subterraneum]|nr:hypothetical protein TSUD_262890 [Trifolium subterraneum]